MRPSSPVGKPDVTQDALYQAAGFLRNHLFTRLHLHYLPTMHFNFDRSTERAAEMNELIARAVASRSNEE